MPPPSIEYRQGKQVKILQQKPCKYVHRSQDNLYIVQVRDGSKLLGNLHSLLIIICQVGFEIKSGTDNMMYMQSQVQRVERDAATLS